MSTARGEVRQGQRRVRVETTETQSMEIRRRRVNIDSPGRNKKIEKSSKMKIGTDEIKRRLERVWKKILLLDRKHQAWMGFGVFLAFYLMIGYGADFLCNFIGFLYPAYASVKAIETKEKDDDTKWLTYWVVYSTFALLEFFTDIFLFWIPLYWFFKCGFLLYCMVPGSYNGSVKIYTSFIRPFVLKHQDKVDKALDQANEIATDLVHEVFGGRLTDREIPATGPSWNSAFTLPNILRHNVQLNQAAADFLQASLSPSTRSTYLSGTRCFAKFILLHNMPTQSFPSSPSEDLFCYFATHCATQLHLSHKTIKLYLCGIRNYYISHGHGDPLLLNNNMPMARLQLLLKGIRKNQSRPSMQRLPITWDILRDMSSQLQQQFFGPYWDELCLAALTLGFYGFLRCGEFTTASRAFSPEVNLCRDDLQPFPLSSKHAGYNLMLRSSKTDPFRQGVSISIFYIGGPCCPVLAMNKFLRLRDAYGLDPSGPLFRSPDGCPLTRRMFSDMLHRLCSGIGLDAARFSGHSLRIGAASTAARQQVPDHLIQVLGRWASDCYKLYIRTSGDTIREAQRALSN